MALTPTRPSTEQLRFTSANTGDQSLDTYLEAAEIGGRSLAALLGDIFDTSGLPIGSALYNWAGSWLTATAYEVGDTFSDPATNDVYVTLIDHTSDTIGNDVTAANIVKVADFSTITAAAAASASAASTSATAAAASAAAALVSENAAAADLVLTNADVVLTNADVALTNADVVLTNADVVSTNADVVSTAQAVTDAEAAQTAAEVALDAFDDDYLGAKASDPTVDNDGDALTDGALYFDTTLNMMKVYDLGTTTWLQMQPTASEMADIATVVADASDIGTVAGISADVTTVAAADTDVSTVAGIDSDVSTVAAVDTDVTTVAGISANVTTVAGISANVTTVAGISADVTTAATNVADITNFADVYVGPSASNPTTRTDTSALQDGDLYFNTASNQMKVYGSSAWSAVALTEASVEDTAAEQAVAMAIALG